MAHLSSWFRGIKAKLLFAALFPVVGFVIVGFVALRGTNEINHLLVSSHRDIIPNLEVLGDLRIHRNRFSAKCFDAILTLQAGKNPDTAVQNAKKSYDEYKKALERYEANSFMPEEEKLFVPMKEKFSIAIQLMGEIVSLVDSKDPKKWDKARDLLQNDFNAIGEHISKYNNEIVKMYETRAANEGRLADETQKSVTQWIWLVTLCSVFLVMGILFWIAARVSNSVSSISERLSHAGTQVATAVEQLNEAGNSLSHSSTEAAASLEETVASLEELSSMVQLNSDNAKQAATLSVSSREAAEKGQQEIETLILAMSKISQSSRKIEEIISVIDDIAFQTNLLALNAAVEAARAGEQGKGFAVVAEAVRALAQRSAAAAKDITNLIKESVEQVEDGGRIAGQSGTVLTNIVNSVKKVSDLNNEIASASTEQTSGIQQINKAMNQLDQASQSNAASAEEIAATSGEISKLATTAQSLTVELSEVINGQGASENQPGPHESKKFETKKTKNNVVALNTRPKNRATSAVAPPKDVIPFDDDTRSKVGTTDGF
ncbi:MAG: methyl-accepting chemotaxis protein [Pseudobdellovibrionaceae bacterium]